MLKKCSKCGKYTLKDKCPKCKSKTASPSYKFKLSWFKKD
ncbi:nucleolar RNA-binding Nop10p family protein [Nanoarchaeota archaeon]